MSPAGSAAALPQFARRAVCRLQLSGFPAQVAGPADLLADLRALFPPAPAGLAGTPAACAPATTYEILPGHPPAETYHVAEGGRLRWTELRREELIPLLEWAIVGDAVDWLGASRLLFHAGAVARRGQGWLLPAASGSGKTTLTAALIAEGFALCSDEVGMLDPSTGGLVPFAKCLCVKEGAHAILAARYPRLFEGASCHRRGAERAWYLRPPDRAWVAAPVPVRVVVFPRYRPGARTAIEPIARPAALPLLLAHSFSARRLGREGVERTVASLRGADCYTLTVGDLATAVMLLRDLGDKADARR